MCDERLQLHCRECPIRSAAAGEVQPPRPLLPTSRTPPPLLIIGLALSVPLLGGIAEAAATLSSGHLSGRIDHDDGHRLPDSTQMTYELATNFQASVNSATHDNADDDSSDDDNDMAPQSTRPWLSAYGRGCPRSC